MTAKELFETLVKTLQPIIQKDEDIIDYAEGSNLTEDEYKCFIIWLTSATICILLNDNTSDVAKEVVEFCQKSLATAQKELSKSGFGDEIGDELGKVLEENIKEWLAIVKQKFQSVEKKGRKTLGRRSGKAEEGETISDEVKDTPASACFKFHTYFLKQVVSREDDVIELTQKYDGINNDILILYVTFNVFYTYLKKIEAGNLDIPEESPIAQNLRELIKICEGLLNKIAEEHIGEGVEDADEFNNDIVEILDDHFQEFIKKMYKYAFRAAQNNK